MPTVRINDFDMFYAVDDYTEPWRKPETILMLHGNAESSAVWYGWVPELAPHFSVVRPDMRGFGASTPMPRDYPWTLDGLIDDYVQLSAKLGIERFHLVGAKIGGTIARAFAARKPDLVKTLTVSGTPAPKRDLANHTPAVVQEFEQKGVRHWAQRTMAGRLGKDFPKEGVDWWIDLMASTSADTQIGFMPRIPTTDITADLPRIKCPTLVISTEGSALGSPDEVRAWQKMIPNSTLVILPGDSYHVSASHAKRCAQETLAFIRRAA